MLVEPNDVKALTRTLRMLIENPKERQWLAAGAREAGARAADLGGLGQASRRRDRGAGMSFSAAWLELREPYDRRARNAAVIEAVVAALAGPAVGHDRRSRLRHRLDVSRAQRRCIKARQNWRLVDNDLSLLARAPQSSPPDINVTTMPIDLNRDLEAALDGPVDLVTTSALLDLVSDEWLQRLVVETAARRLPVYAALSYDGRIEMTPADAADEKIIAAVNAHQRTDKGFGPALGPEAAQAAIERFERVGYAVVQGASDWVFAPTGSRNPDRDAVGLGGRGARDRRCAAARRDRLADAPARSRRRRALVDPRRSRRFFRAADRARAEPTGRSRTAPRRRAGARCIGVSSASSTRAIGGSEKLGRPEPRMIGATMMCSRSRHFAARKRDTVSAPPSISTRRRPRSASAARIAAGAICPSVLGEADDLDVGRQRRPGAGAGHDQAAHAVVGQKLGAGRKPPARHRSRPAPAAGR